MLLTHGRRAVRRAEVALRRRTGTLRLPRGGMWSIGLYGGPSLDRLVPCGSNPVLTSEDVTDMSAAFVADPFMIQVDGVWFMYFEAFNAARGKGEICVASSQDLKHWRYEGVVLRESFHLSYPLVFAWSGNHYMVPETAAAGQIRLYRAVDFPMRWVLDHVLWSGLRLYDATPFEFDGRWWCFVETDSRDRFDTLTLLTAETPLGRWTEHPASPLVVGDPHRARPAGRVVVADGALLRLTQDCHPAYGLRVHGVEIAELTTETYREHRRGKVLVEASGAGWNATGMHHVDAHPDGKGGWLACVDGRGQVATVASSGA